MNSWSVWIVFAVVTVMLWLIAYNFSVRTLRWVTLIVALVTAGYLTAYGLRHPAVKHSSLPGDFARSADTLSSALIRPLSLGHHVPAPGRIGWLVIGVLLVLGYRLLEALTLHHQGPCLDVSELASDRQDDATGADPNAQTGRQWHDWVVAELKFRLPAVEVRLPAILPGGSRPNGLASIAEATGVTGAGLAGAIIRFFGMVWPNPPKVQVRAWVERTPGQKSIDGPTRVTVSLADSQSGAALATKTLAAGNLDKAVAVVAGYVARYIFAQDCTVPPWCVSATDGADLAVLLLARQVRRYPQNRSAVRGAWHDQIDLLRGAAQGNLCAGVVRYELAQLHDLTGEHVQALLLHAANREQYPRFYRGRYRLAMSLEMLASPDFGLDKTDMFRLKRALQILDRCCVTDKAADKIDDCGSADPDSLRWLLLAAAWQELQEIRRYLTLRHIVWRSLRHRDERAILLPYLRLRHRQAFHDGVCVAQLLVAVRQELWLKAKASNEPPEAEAGNEPPRAEASNKLGHARTVARIVAAISEDIEVFREVLGKFPFREMKKQPITTRLHTRRWPWQRCTPSWPAAYNLACAYAALAAAADAKTTAPGADAKTTAPGADPKTPPDPLIQKVIDSLEFAVCNPECEMERPSEWIRSDPDFSGLSENVCFKAFQCDQQKRDYPDGG